MRLIGSPYITKHRMVNCHPFALQSRITLPSQSTQLQYQLFVNMYLLEKDLSA